jgi:hypothetical protein
MLVSHNTDTGLGFYNDRVKEIIAADLIAEPFTYVPIVAGHMELVGGNAIVFGKITEGYDVISPVIETEVTYKMISGIDSGISLAIVYFLVSNQYITNYRIVTGLIQIVLPFIPNQNTLYYISIENPTDGINITGVYTVQPGDAVANVKAGLEADLISKGAEIITDPLAYRISMYLRSKTFMDGLVFEAGDVQTIFKNFTFTATVLNVGFATKFPILKCGSVHSFGIVYKDRAGRTCSVVRPEAMDVYIPFYSELGDNSIQTIAELVFKISNRPPEWAESYEIVYFGNVSMDYFMQIRADAIEAVPNSSHRYALNVQATFDWTMNENMRWKVPPYVWTQGDRIRLLGIVYNETGIVLKYDTPGQTYDYEIEETATEYGEAIGGDWLIFQAIQKPAQFLGQSNILVEIYRPRKGLNFTTAYGTGMVFDIAKDSFGNKYHKGDVDQVFNQYGVCVTPASVNNTANDSWKFLRINYIHNTGNVWPFWAESIFPSDWWGGQVMENRLTSMGFPFLDDLSQRQMVLNQRGRHGGFLITGTRTNNIAHFTYDDFFDLAEKDGEITGMREVGFTLKMIQKYKETSIYINRIQTFNPDGTEQFTLTDTFLGTIRPMDDDYGCQHPDGITVNGRNLYYWDNSQGVFIRSAPNGQQAISGPEYKMSRYFKDIVRWIQTSGGAEALQVRIGANNEHDEIWITFRMNGEVRGLIFKEKQDRYISHIDQITESYIHLGNFFAHLYQQRVWIMNLDEGQDFLSWSGSLKYAEIEVVSNAEPLKNKVFNAVAVFADHLLQSLAKFVHIPKEASASNRKMESNIPVWTIENREGIYFGEIMKDENSKGNFVSVYDRKLNGDEMRGRYCFVKLRSTEHSEKVRIDSIVVFSTPSERNI